MPNLTSRFASSLFLSPSNLWPSLPFPFILSFLLLTCIAGWMRMASAVVATVDARSSVTVVASSMIMLCVVRRELEEAVVHFDDSLHAGGGED